MNRPASHAEFPPPTIKISDGWHCLHLYYRINQRELLQINESERKSGLEQVLTALDPQRPGAPIRLQSFVVSGHKADFGVIMFDADPIVLDSVRQALRSSNLGPALELTYSFVSLTEISEYVPTLEQYAERLKHEGNDPSGPAFAAKLKAYEDREVVMRKQRLFPDLPPWPVITFYPMNKIRHPLANWYVQPYSHRMDMMTEHGRSGMKFAGRVTQVITASTGLDDWEWGVTLWGRSPEAVKEIVYTMRFDEASAKYAEFGPFYFGYITPAAEIMRHLQLA